MTVEPQPAGPTFARSARVNGTCTTYERIYIYIYIKNIYIYIYDEDFSQLYDKCGARAARQIQYNTVILIILINTPGTVIASMMYITIIIRHFLSCFISGGSFVPPHISSAVIRNQTDSTRSEDNHCSIYYARTSQPHALRNSDVHCCYCGASFCLILG